MNLYGGLGLALAVTAAVMVVVAVVVAAGVLLNRMATSDEEAPR
jgi:hypothetical protein